MKYLETHFIDLDQKWVAIKNKKNIEEIEKATGKKLKGEFYLGYSYIDHFTGRSIALLGGVEKIANKYQPTYSKEQLKENISKIDDIYMKESLLEVEVLKEKDINDILKKAIKQYINENFYKPLHKSIYKMRKEKNIDKQRAYHNPDNINILLDEEKLWCSVVEKEKEKLYAILINTPRDNKKINRDDLLILKYNKQNQRYVYEKNIKPKEKTKSEITYEINNKIKKYVFDGE